MTSNEYPEQTIRTEHPLNIVVLDMRTLGNLLHSAQKFADAMVAKHHVCQELTEDGLTHGAEDVYSALDELVVLMRERESK